MKEKTILITGGAGFIGSNLCEYFLSKKYKVICLDNFATGYRHNVKDFINNADFHLIEGDIRNLVDCQRAVQGVDYVLHQAALGSVPRSINDPITTNDVNVSGFLNMLVASRDAKLNVLFMRRVLPHTGIQWGCRKWRKSSGNHFRPMRLLNM